MTRTLTDITFGDGHYVIAGGDHVGINMYDIYSTYSTTVNVLLQSTNAANWEDITLRVPAYAPLNSVAFLGDSFWLGGESGALLQSDSLTGIPRLAGFAQPGGAGFQVKVTINVPSSFRIQASTNAKSWQDCMTVTNPSSQTVFLDSNTAGVPQKFYRLVSP